MDDRTAIPMEPASNLRKPPSTVRVSLGGGGSTRISTATRHRTQASVGLEACPFAGPMTCAQEGPQQAVRLLQDRGRIARMRGREDASMGEVGGGASAGAAFAALALAIAMACAAGRRSMRPQGPPAQPMQGRAGDAEAPLLAVQARE